MSITKGTLNKIISQYRHENDTWKRYLHFMQQENNYLKTRLGQVLQNDIDIDFLDRAEYFQTKFLNEDETVNLLRQDVHEIDELLHNGVAQNAALLKELQNKIKKLSRDMETIERQFNKLKTDFNVFLSEAA
jgi:hypothetical protein